MQPFREGDFACTVGGYGEASRIRRGPGVGFEYQSFTGVIYQAVARKKDGKVTWRRSGTFGPICRDEVTEGFIRRLKEISPHPWIDDIRQNMPVPNFENLIMDVSIFDLSP